MSLFRDNTAGSTVHRFTRLLTNWSKNSLVGLWLGKQIMTDLDLQTSVINKDIGILRISNQHVGIFMITAVSLHFMISPDVGLWGMLQIVLLIMGLLLIKF